jgi:hypothetical protein
MSSTSSDPLEPKTREVLREVTGQVRQEQAEIELNKKTSEIMDMLRDRQGQAWAKDYKTDGARMGQATKKMKEGLKTNLGDDAFFNEQAALINKIIWTMHFVEKGVANKDPAFQQLVKNTYAPMAPSARSKVVPSLVKELLRAHKARLAPVPEDDTDSESEDGSDSESEDGSDEE